MKAIITAAGKGSRMGELTEKVPKPLIKVSGKPIMEHIVNLLVRYGVEEIGINIFYLGDQIKDYFGNGKKWGIKIAYAEEKELTGVGGGMKAAAKALSVKEPFIMIPGDTIPNFDLSSLYKFHLKHDGIATLSVFYRPKNAIKDCGIILFDKKTKRLIKYIEKPQKKEDVISLWASAGVYVFDPEILELIPEEMDGSKVIDLPKQIFPIIFDIGKKMYVYPFNRKKYYFLGINNPEEIQQIEEDLRKGIISFT